MTQYGGLFEDELRAFAYLEQSIKESITEQQAQIDRIRALYEAAIAPFQESIEAQQAIIDQQREALADEIHQHIIQNSSEGLHHTIHHSTRREPIFDKDAALQAALALCKTEFIRTKHELNLVALKPTLRDGVDWIEDITWEVKTHISFPKLGEFLIVGSDK